MRHAELSAASTLIDILHERAIAAPDALAYSVPDEISYGDLRQEALRVAANLAKKGCQRGDRCGLVLPTGIDFLRAIYGVQLLGAAPIAINAALPLKSVIRRLSLVQCEFALVQSATVNDLRSAKADSLRAGTDKTATRIEAIEDLTGSENQEPRSFGPVRPRDTAYLQFTSGTAGEPRAAVISHQNLIAFLRASQKHMGVTRDDVFVGWVPLYHDLGLVRFVFEPLFSGCPSYLLQPSMASLAGWLETAARVRATITASPDFGYRIAAHLVDPEGLDLSALRFATNGGESVRASTIDRFERRFGLSQVVRPGYGLAEATLGVTSLRPNEPLRVDSAGNVSCGPPLDGFEVKIVDDRDRALPPGQPGNILVRGEAVFAGYFQCPEETNRVLRGGWLHTGDVGWLDKDGHLYISGRKRALIKRAGALIAPREIEETVDGLKGVRFSAAIGLAREATGGTEDVVVIVEIRPRAAASEADRASVTKAVAAEVSRTIGFSPGSVVLVAPRSIPRTDNGKTKYNELRRLVVEGELARSGAILYDSSDRV